MPISRMAATPLEHCPAGTVEKVTCWPISEDPNNLNMTIGKLGLSDNEEDEIIAFLKTLTDVYKPPPKAP
jgi:cytochrome c peroxidase